MISEKELFVMNTMLDDRDFFALPSLKNMKLSALLAERVYQSLIRKGLILDVDNFTQKGIELLRRMADYKDAKRYVRFGALILGIYKENFAIALIQNPLQGLCTFERIKVLADDVTLKKMYPFLNQEQTEDLLPDQLLTYDELTSKFNLCSNNVIYLSSFDMEMAVKDLEEATTNEIIFFENGRFYCYDRNHNILHCCMLEKVLAIMRERLVVV